MGARARGVAVAVTALMALGMSPARAAAPQKLAPCLACHGADGQSQTAGVPSLGGEPPKYVLIQLFMFREGLRTAEPMNSLMKSWSDADLQQAADFIASLPAPKPPSGAVDAARLARAQTLIADNHCNVCHRPNFSGEDNVPHLADQRADYLLKTLHEYKTGARHGYDATMAEVLQPLNDAQIADLAYYLAHFSPAPAAAAPAKSGSAAALH